MNELNVELNAPGMTALHRAGVAGLYMTVRALEARHRRPPGWRGWELTKRDVRLRWDGSAERFFDELVKASFGISNDYGLIDFAAIDQAKASLAARWIAHEGMLGTFCQFGPNNGLGSRKSIRLPSEDDEHPIHFEYRPIDPGSSKRGRTYPHRDTGGAEIGRAIDKGTSVPLVGWLFPGAVIRHNAYAAETAFDEDPAKALALVYAPVGCFYFKIQSRRQERKARFALLVPYIDDLDAYAAARLAAATDISVGELISSSAGDAALRLLTRLRARSLAQDAGLPRISVILLGIVVWNEKQKSRTGIMNVEVRSDQQLTRYEHVRALLEATSGTKKDGTSYLLLSPSLELFADNIALGRPFYEGFTSLVCNKEIRDWLRADQKGLSKVVDDENTFEDARERLFVGACHESLRHCYRVVADRAEKDGVEPGPRFKKEYDRWRNAFARAKNADSFREAVTDFWSRAGSNSVLRTGWKDVLPMLSPARWKQGRDLALLALASYARTESTSDDKTAENGQEEQE